MLVFLSQPALQIIEHLSPDELKVLIQICIHQFHGKMKHSPAHGPPAEYSRDSCAVRPGADHTLIIIFAGINHLKIGQILSGLIISQITGSSISSIIRPVFSIHFEKQSSA